MKRVMFFHPTPGERWTDEAVTSLVGQHGDATWLGAPMGEGVIIRAERVTKFGQEGLWIEAEVPDLPPLIDTPSIKFGCVSTPLGPGSDVVFGPTEVEHADGTIELVSQNRKEPDARTAD